MQTDASVLHGPPNKGYVRHSEGTNTAVLLYSSVFYCTPTFYLRMASISRSTVAAATGVSAFRSVCKYIVIFVVCMRLWLDREFLG